MKARAMKKPKQTKYIWQRRSLQPSSTDAVYSSIHDYNDLKKRFHAEKQMNKVVKSIGILRTNYGSWVKDKNLTGLLKVASAVKSLCRNFQQNNHQPLVINMT